MEPFVGISKPCTRCGTAHHEAGNICWSCTNLLAFFKLNMTLSVADVIDLLVEKDTL